MRESPLSEVTKLSLSQFNFGLSVQVRRSKTWLSSAGVKTGEALCEKQKTRVKTSGTQESKRSARGDTDGSSCGRDGAFVSHSGGNVRVEHHMRALFISCSRGIQVPTLEGSCRSEKS